MSIGFYNTNLPANLRLLKDEIEEQRRKDKYLLPLEGSEGDEIESP